MIPTLSLSLLLCASAGAGDQWRQYSSPEEAGFSAEGLAEARALAEESDSAAVFVVYRGHVLVAWGDVTRRFKCHSVRKSLLSGLIGIHVAEGRVDRDATLADLGIDDRDGLTDVEKGARVADLLRARSGVYHPAAKEPSDMEAGRPARGSHPSGEHWWYNNWDFNTLLPIYEQETGERVFEDFARRIAEPIGMDDYRPEDCYYQLEPSKSQHAAYAFRLSARDLARFGELFRRKGTWEGQSVIPADWVVESTDSHSVFAGGDGYGYMWWTYPAGSMGASYPALDAVGTYSARGTGGQVLLVSPLAELVFVHRGDTDNDRRVSGRAIWRMAELILAAMVDEPRSDPELMDVLAVPFEHPGPEPTWPAEVRVDPEVLTRVAGDYELAPGMTARVYVYEDRLFLNSPGGEFELYAAGEAHFFSRAADLELEFLSDEAGKVTAALVRFEGSEGEAPRL